LSASYPIVIVTGARQVGKTTLLKQMKDSPRGYVSLGILKNRILANEEPAAFLLKHSPPVIIDEIQYAPELISYLFANANGNKENGALWLAGPICVASMNNVTDIPTEYVSVLNLHGLSHSEITRLRHDEYVTDHTLLVSRINKAKPLCKEETYAKIVRGGMPYLYSNLSSTPQDYFDAYIQAYLLHDIMNKAQITDEVMFYKFMQECGSHITKPVDYTNIAMKVGITDKKAKHWVSILVSLGIIILLQPYANNELKRTVKTPKLYFMDTGLLCYLRGICSAEACERDAESGDLFENYVVSEIYKSYACVGKQSPFYYYRDANNRKEINLIIEQNRTVYPINVTSCAKPDISTVKQLDVLSSLSNVKVGTGNVICNSSSMYQISHDVWAVPHWLI